MPKKLEETAGVEGVSSGGARGRSTVPSTRNISLFRHEMADDDDDRCFGDTIPSFEPCDEDHAQVCAEKIAADKNLAPYHANRYINSAAKQWDRFYNRNENKFFKDRHYLLKEFEEMEANLGTAENPVSMFEVGCGVGNTFFPMLEKMPHLKAYGVDFAPHAIECIQKQERFDPARCSVWVCDVARDPFPAELPQVDYATMIFVLSAMPHELMPNVVKKVFDSLKPGGYLFFRDYARFDLTQMRFKSGAKINEDLYVRWDGTLTAYLTRELAEKMFTEAGFIMRENLYHRKSIYNRKKGIEMRRVWLQCRAYKPRDDAERAELSTPEARERVHQAALLKIREAEERHRQRVAAVAAVAADGDGDGDGDAADGDNGNGMTNASAHSASTASSCVSAEQEIKEASQ